MSVSPRSWTVTAADRQKQLPAAQPQEHRALVSSQIDEGVRPWCLLTDGKTHTLVWGGCQTVVPSHWREDSRSLARGQHTVPLLLHPCFFGEYTVTPHLDASAWAVCPFTKSVVSPVSRTPSGSPTNTSLLLSALGMPSLCSCCPGWSLCFSLPVCSSSCLVYTAFLCSSVLHHSFVFKMVLYGCRFLIHVTFRK